MNSVDIENVKKILALIELAFLHGQQSVQEEIHALASHIPDSALSEDIRTLIECSRLYWKKENEKCKALIKNLLGGAFRPLETPFGVLGSIIYFKSCIRLHQFHDALSVVSSTLDAAGEGTVLERMALRWAKGQALSFLHRYEEALVCVDEAYAISIEAGYRLTAAVINIDRAVIVSQSGDPLRAIVMYESSILDLSKAKETHGLMCLMARFNVATVYPVVGRDEDALEMYTIILEESLAIGIEDYRMPVRLNMAISLKRLQRSEESRQAYMDVLGLATSNSNQQYRFRALIGLADLSLSIDDLESAREMASKAVGLANEIGIDSMRYEALANLSAIMHKEGDRSEAIENLSIAFHGMMIDSDSMRALEYGRLLTEWYTQEGLHKEAFLVLQKCADRRGAIYKKEIERTIELTEIRSKLDHDREAVRARDEERKKILDSVLPQRIVDRLMAGEKHIADNVDGVTIMFADIVGFTKMAANMDPEELVDLLERLFNELDRICSHYGCERVKTIGDSYMAICGASVEHTDHVERLCSAALEIVSESSSLTIDHGRLRIGIHTGPVVAGVMGGARLSFDVWGDTVNTAARMEVHSEPGRILCSQAVADALDSIDGLSLEKREPLDIKGKGLMTTYWLSRS